MIFSNSPTIQASTTSLRCRSPTTTITDLPQTINLINITGLQYHHYFSLRPNQLPRLSLDILHLGSTLRRRIFLLFPAQVASATGVGSAPDRRELSIQASTNAGQAARVFNLNCSATNAEAPCLVADQLSPAPSFILLPDHHSRRNLTSSLHLDSDYHCHSRQRSKNSGDLLITVDRNRSDPPPSIFTEHEHHCRCAPQEAKRLGIEDWENHHCWQAIAKLT